MKRIALSLLLLFSFALLIGAAQPDATATLSEIEGVGPVLTTPDGFALYLFLNDVDAVSACYDQCAVNWPPLLVEGDPVAGEGLDPALLGTSERTDGSMQVTYGGWPLYTFVRDEAAGAINGQGVGEVWYLVGADGLGVGRPEQTDGADADMTDEERLAMLMEVGDTVYDEICASCHGRNGQGAEGPALAGYGRLSSTRILVRQILRGGREMPRFGDVLDDTQVAGVATFVRNSWGNDYGVVTPEEVAAER